MAFSVLTWNIWFENLHYETRMREIFRQCSALKPDIIAFRTAPPLCSSPCACLCLQLKCSQKTVRAPR